MDIIAEEKLKTASQIYYCLVKTVANNKCLIEFNNKEYNVPYFGGAPIPNKTYALFLPQNNINQAFIIGEGGGGSGIIDDEQSISSTNPLQNKVVTIEKAPTIYNNKTDSIVSIEDGVLGLMNKSTVDFKFIQNGSPTPSNPIPIDGFTGLTLYNDPKYGGMIHWNQMLREMTSTYWEGESGVTVTFNGGVATVSSTTAGNGLKIKNSYRPTVTSGHVYIVWINVKVPTAGMVLTIGPGSTTGLNIQTTIDVADTWYTLGYVKAATSTSTANIYLYPSSASGTYSGLQVRNYQIFDITDMFGAEVAAEVLAGGYTEARRWLYNLFPNVNEFYAYNAGEYTNVSAVSNLPYSEIEASWQTEAGTIYGGTFNALTGKLIVTWAAFDGGDVEWTKVDGYSWGNFKTTNIVTASPSNSDKFVWSDWYVPDTAAGTGVTDNFVWSRGNDSNHIYVKDTSKSSLTAEQFQAAVDGCLFVYKLATPVEYQLTASVVECYLNNNNIWAVMLGGNLVDESTNTTGYYINASGNPVQSNDAQYTALIPVTTGDTYTWSLITQRTNATGKNRIHGYNSSGVWQQQIDFKEAGTKGSLFLLTDTIPSGISNVRLSYGISDTEVWFGNGSMYIDADETVTIEYPCDTKSYVDSKVISTPVSISEGGTEATTVEQARVNLGIKNALYFTGQAVSATTGDICTISNAAITEDFVLVSCVFASSGSIAAGATWTTSNGSFVINGTCTAATTVSVVLVPKDN